MKGLRISMLLVPGASAQTLAGSSPGGVFSQESRAGPPATAAGSAATAGWSPATAVRSAATAVWTAATAGGSEQTRVSRRASRGGGRQTGGGEEQKRARDRHSGLRERADGEPCKPSHERPKGRPVGPRALRQRRAGAIGRGMGEGRCGGGDAWAMIRMGRARRFVRWAAVGSALVVAVTYLASFFVVTMWIGASSGWGVGIVGGAAAGVWTDPATLPIAEGPGLHMRRRPPILVPMHWWPRFDTRPGYANVIIPLWIPLLLVGPAAAMLWVADRRATRRAAKGRCASCGYDRAGLAVGVKCPECGTLPTS